VARDGFPAIRIEAAGETRSERLLWTVVLGDLVSLELAKSTASRPRSTLNRPMTATIQRIWPN